MAPNPIKSTNHDTDLSPRMVSSSTVVGSPALAAETVVCQITGLDTSIAVVNGVFLSGVASFTVGTSGASVRLRIRTGTTAGSGTVVADTGVLTAGISAGVLVSQDLQGFDTTNANLAVGGSYCLTLTIGSGGATSTVSQTNLFLIIV